MRSMRSNTPSSSANGATGAPQTRVSVRSGKLAAARRAARAARSARLPPPIILTKTSSPRGSLRWSRRSSAPASCASGRRTTSSHAPSQRSMRCFCSTVTRAPGARPISPRLNQTCESARARRARPRRRAGQKPQVTPDHRRGDALHRPEAPRHAEARAREDARHAGARVVHPVVGHLVEPERAHQRAARRAGVGRDQQHARRRGGLAREPARQRVRVGHVLEAVLEQPEIGRGAAARAAGRRRRAAGRGTPSASACARLAATGSRPSTRAPRAWSAARHAPPPNPISHTVSPATPSPSAPSQRSRLRTLQRPTSGSWWPRAAG